jgi:hypothetical protein
MPAVGSLNLDVTSKKSYSPLGDGPAKYENGRQSAANRTAGIRIVASRLAVSSILFDLVSSKDGEPGPTARTLSRPKGEL